MRTLILKLVNRTDESMTKFDRWMAGHTFYLLVIVIVATLLIILIPVLIK